MFPLFGGNIHYFFFVLIENVFAFLTCSRSSFIIPSKVACILMSDIPPTPLIPFYEKLLGKLVGARRPLGYGKEVSFPIK